MSQDSETLDALDGIVHRDLKPRMSRSETTGP